MKERVTIVSMGCSKNLVDSERLAARLADAGIEVQFASDFGVNEFDNDGSHIVVNTCGFIGDAKEESIDAVLAAIQLKTSGRAKSVYMMGCLGERYRKELAEEFTELDGLYGKFDWDGIVEAIGRHRNGKVKTWERIQATAPHYTYIKISEGCNRFCAFCAIPLITGRHRSRTSDEILEEVRRLAAAGTCEFNIIAQDLSSYGNDLTPRTDSRSPLAALIESMADIPGVEMIRLHYAYPADFPLDVLDVMRENPKVCRYLDIALQHIDDTVLTNMRRHIDSKATRELLKEIRRRVPGIHIRTTMMVGFPGEDDAAFERLLDFVREQRFERLGAFAYCEEEDTYAARNYIDEITEDVKQHRLDRLMDIQQDIAEEINNEKIGKTFRVIIDEENDDEYIGRTEFDSPEVDGCVFIPKDMPLEIGRIYNVEITGSSFFDLEGKVIEAE